MAKYHVSEDGNPRVCKAKNSCPYGDLTEDHYASKDEAREAFEKSQKQVEQASLEGAKRGQTLLSNLDATYKALENEAKAEHMVGETKKIAEEIFGKRDTVTPRRGRPYDPDAMDDHAKKGLVDSMEGRTGEKYADDTMLKVKDGKGNEILVTADAVGETLPTGIYEGVDAETGMKAFVRVYSDSTSRATKPDLRDDLAYRHKRALQKKDDFKKLAQELNKEADEVTRPQIAQLYRNTADLLDAHGQNTDWSNLDTANEVLDEIYELEEEYMYSSRSYHERDNELSLAYDRAKQALFDAQDGGYEIAGKQKLPPMKKDA